MMKWFKWIVAAGCLLGAGDRADAFKEPGREPIPNFDARHDVARPLAGRPQKRVALDHIATQLPGVKVEWDEIVGSPKVVRAADGFLSGPGAKGRGIPAKATALFPKDPHRATKAFLHEHRELFGHGAEAIEGARVKREFITEHNGLRTTVWQQEVDGIPVHEGILISHQTPQEELVFLSSHWIPDPVEASKAGAANRAAPVAEPTVPAEEAVTRAAGNIGEEIPAEKVKGIGLREAISGRQLFRVEQLSGETQVQLVWLPMNDRLLRLCWEVILTSGSRGETFRILVEAHNGEVLLRHCLTEYISEASYRVYTSDSPSPFSPGHLAPLTNQPPLVERTLVTLAALSTNASPAGWINDGANHTLGNNVEAHLDRDANDIPDPGSRPQGSPARVFDFPLNLQDEPIHYTNAAVVQLFYWNNWMHDRLYDLGFTEAAGNFQVTNFGRGGNGNDPVLADAQDGSGSNNANMTTLPDGISPRMQMYRFTGPNPNRDGDLDAEIILHEYTHGLSSRRVGGGVGLSALQSRGMGEGWSDFYALALLSESGDDIHGNYPLGGYVTYLTGPEHLQNYYFGIRRYPYSTDLTISPLTFKDIDPGQASAHPGIPRNPFFAPTADSVHNMGEVWCLALWEARANLVAKHGFSVGNEMILQLVTDGMNLSPANPNFLQARDAILQADRVNHGGANQTELWAAFAKRGMGFAATSPASTTAIGVRESFAMPDRFLISPPSGFTAVGPVGGPFKPAGQLVVLSNAFTEPLPWAAGTSAQWLGLARTNGVLAGATGEQVLLSLKPSANQLPSGIHTGFVLFTNITSGNIQTRRVTVRVGSRDYFTELFAGDHDLDYQSITFTPDGSTHFYSGCREEAFRFPTDPTGGTNLAINNSSFLKVTLPTGTNVSLYGKATNIFFIGSGGSITFNSGDGSVTPSLSTHFNRTRISAFMANLRPQTHGKVTLQILSDRVAVTFQDVPEYNTSKFNNFQTEMFYDGRIRITQLHMGTSSGLTGLSAGLGTPAGFVESDLSNYSQCFSLLSLSAPTNAVEGDGVIEGRVTLATPRMSALSVRFQNNDPSELNLPSNLIIPAGATSAVFEIGIVDESELDGRQQASLVAFAEGYGPVAATIAVDDNEVGDLAVILPLNATEGSGSFTGQVTVHAPPARNVAVSLQSGDTSKLTVAASVIIPAGATSATFSASAVNDTKIDGTVSVMVTASVPGWNSGIGQILILDNETTNLTVELPTSINEGQSSGTGTVRISGTLPTNLVVTLQSSDTSAATVPSSVTISAGSVSKTFNITILDDELYEATRQIVINASAPGFVNGSRSMTLYDNDHPAVPTNPTPVNMATNIAANTALTWSSGESSAKTNLFHIYLGTSSTLGATNYLGSTSNKLWNLPLLAPLTTYYWKIVSERGGTTQGPVWRFTTRGVDHFDWSAIESPQIVNRPFQVTITARDEFGQVVSNYVGSVHLRGHQSDESRPVVKILSFTGYSDMAKEYPNTLAAIGNHFSDFVVSSTTNTNVASLHNLLEDKNVFLIPEQEPIGASLSLFSQLGSYWQKELTNFVHNGGMVIACSYQNNEHLILNNAGLLQLTRVDWIGTGTVAVAGSHPLTENLPPSFQTAYIGRYNSGNGTAVLLSGALNDGVAYAKDFGSGHTVMIGTDYNLTNTPMDKVIANAIRWAQADIKMSVPTSPAVSGMFTNGTWTGMVTIQEPMQGMYLRAANAAGQSGVSAPFDVAPSNDIALVMTGSPPTVGPGATVSYDLVAVNTGPSASAGVVVTNFLPVEATLISATTSHGTIINTGNTIICNLANLPGGSNLTITIRASFSSPGTFTNRATISRNEADLFLLNNTASAVTTVVMPELSINDVTLNEGDAGMTEAHLSIRSSVPSGQPISVDIATANNTALAGSDYVATNGTITFMPGETNRNITVSVIGDLSNEPTETFFVVLTNAVNATIVRRSGTGTIINDDFVPELRIAAATLIQEFCMPTNGVIDPGEMVTLAITLANDESGADAMDVYATLLSTNGILPETIGQRYGPIAAGASATRYFSFTAGNVDCGESVAAMLQLVSGGLDLGTVSQSFQLCGNSSGLNENFDALIPPSVPSGWSTYRTGTGTNWSTTSAAKDTSPNSIFAPNTPTASDNFLTSPSIIVASTNAQLTFRHSYNTELHFDGAVLEVSINGGTFTNINAAGGSFIAGGYNGFNKWTGDSGGFITTVVRLPASAAGQSVRLQWRLVSDISRAGIGWYVDSISLLNERVCLPGLSLALQIARLEDELVIRWHGPITYTLEMTETLSPAHWMAVTNSALVTNGAIVFREPIIGQRYYRMVK